MFTWIKSLFGKKQKPSNPYQDEIDKNQKEIDSLKANQKLTKGRIDAELLRRGYDPDDFKGEY